MSSLLFSVYYSRVFMARVLLRVYVWSWSFLVVHFRVIFSTVRSLQKTYRTYKTGSNNDREYGLAGVIFLFFFYIVSICSVLCRWLVVTRHSSGRWMTRGGDPRPIRDRQPGKLYRSPVTREIFSRPADNPNLLDLVWKRVLDDSLNVVKMIENR